MWTTASVKSASLKSLAIAGMLAAAGAATPAAAAPPWERGYDRQDYRGGFDRGRDSIAQRAYYEGLQDGRRGYSRENDYRAKFARAAYKDGYKDGRRDRRDVRADYRDSRNYRDYRDDRGDYRPVYYNRASDYRGDWYGRDGRSYDSYDRCRSKNGINTGTILGGLAGGVLGNEVAGRGDKTVGTIIGAAAGAVIGHEVGKGDSRKRYCY